MQVWVLPGMTSVGNETNMGLWTQVATGSGTGAGTNVPTHVTLSNPFALNAGTLNGIALIADPSFGHFYTNGTGGNQNYSNADLSIALGSATNVPFTAPVFTPRVWNGTIYYGGVCGTPTNTPTNTPTATPTGSATPTPTATCTPGGGLPGMWTNGTTGPPLRYRAGGTSDGTYVYVYGGSNDVAAYLNDLWRWDPGTGTWTQLANMPTGKSNIQGAYWNGKIYVPGGYIGSHITENAIYDIATNTWTTGAPLPAAQSGSNVAYNGKIYDFGGNPGPQAAVEIYDIATNTWSAGAAMPVATTYGRAVVAGNFAYMVGGITTVTVASVYRYDFAANTWATMAPLQTARTSEELMASPDGSKLYAVMGGDASFFTGVPLAQSVEIYDVATNTWTYGNPVVTKAAAPSGGLAGGMLMVEGGVDGTVYLNAVQVSTLQGGGCGTPTPTGTATNTPTATPTGTPTTGCGENFDGVTAPALPAGWTTSASGVEVPWVTSTNAPDTAPNEAFAPDPNNIGNTELFSPAYAISAGGGAFSFRNNYNTESTFDGMVLEISIDGGAYADILAAGGSFVTGGYNATISTAFMSPIAGRMAWSGNSGGYITSTVMLPASANGHMINLKWRMASDNSVAAIGVMVDTITSIPCNMGTPTNTPTTTPTGTPTNTPTATPTITPTPGMLSVQFDSDTYYGDESQTEPVTLNRMGDTSGTTTVMFTTTDGTAHGGGCGQWNGL